ncbi:hypothetical protein ACI7RC_11140 [Brevibacillus sp. B_LB10_24]|uniref:hypothetical protein n=1 Tax=Brevibacillus sp. B_LB10_24 TaxID=3380645 RepID=UPI0038BA1983
MSKLFDTWVGAVALEMALLGAALIFSDNMKFVIFMVTFIAATLIVGATYLLLKKESSSKTDM